MRSAVRSPLRHLTPALPAALAVLLAAGLLLAAPGPAPAENAPRRIVAGWLRPAPYQAAGLQSIHDNADLWSDASPFWYTATGATTVTGSADPSVVSALHVDGIAVLPTVTETLSTPQMESLLAGSTSRAALRSRLVGLVTDHGYDGIDLDFEAMNFGGTVTQKQHVATLFVTFLRELNTALDARGKRLSVTVGPRRSGTDPSWAVFDYARIGALVDRFRIMTYDLHYRGSDPGPVAPLPWTESVVGYAVTVVPAGRIQMGVPLYGYDWPTDGAHHAIAPATSLSTYQQAEQLRTSKDAVRQWSAVDAAPYFTYRDGDVLHEVWYNDAQSTTAKMTLVGTYHLKGMALWHLSGEDATQWPAIRTYAVQRATTLTATAPATITYGSSLEIPARLRITATGAPVSGATLRLQRTTTDTWSYVHDPLTTAADGTAGFVAAPPTTCRFRVLSAAAWSYAAAVSRPLSVAVRYRVTAGFVASTVRRGTAAVLRGTVGPARTGTRVERQRLVGSTWTTVAATTTSSTGSYSFRFTWSTPGSRTYRVRVPGTSQNATGYSREHVLTVT